MEDVRASKRPRSRRIGLRPLAQPAPNSYWILCNPTEYFDDQVYRIVIVVETQRKYVKAGHQSSCVVFFPAQFKGWSKTKQVAYRYSLAGEEFSHLFRKLEGEEFADEMAMMLLANV